MRDSALFCRSKGPRDAADGRVTATFAAVLLCRDTCLREQRPVSPVHRHVPALLLAYSTLLYVPSRLPLALLDSM